MIFTHCNIIFYHVIICKLLLSPFLIFARVIFFYRYIFREYLNRCILVYLSHVQRSPRYIPRNFTANQYFRRIQRVSCLYDVSLPTRSLQDVWVCRISVLFNQARGLCPSNARVTLRKYWEPMTLGPASHIRVARRVIFRWFPAGSGFLPPRHAHGPQAK